MTKVFAVAVSLLTLSLGTVALSFTTIDVEAGLLSANGSAAQSINDRGDVVGFTMDEIGKGHPYLVRKGVVTFFEPPSTWGAVESAPRSMNSSGDIVGEYYPADGTIHGFLRSHLGKWTSLDVPGAEGGTFAQGINGQGEIVGVAGGFVDPNIGTNHGFLFRPGHDRAPGSYLPIDFPGADSTYAVGINDDGDVVGFYYLRSEKTFHGFLQHEGDFTTVDVPGTQGIVVLGTNPRSINSSGEIAGQFWTDDGGYHGFLLSKGTYTTFDMPGALMTGTMSINDHGEIVGFYFDEAWMAHGFKAVRAH